MDTIVTPGTGQATSVVNAHDRAGRLAAELRVLRDDAAAVLGPVAAADLDLLIVRAEMFDETEAARLGRLRADYPDTELEI